MSDGYAQRERAQNIRFGGLMAVICNTTPRRDKRIYRWTDFYQDEKKPGPEMTADEIYQKSVAMFGRYRHNGT